MNALGVAHAVSRFDQGKVRGGLCLVFNGACDGEGVGKGKDWSNIRGVDVGQCT